MALLIYLYRCEPSILREDHRRQLHIELPTRKNKCATAAGVLTPTALGINHQKKYNARTFP
jgi:hypothetical protein